MKKVFIKNSQHSHENTCCARASISLEFLASGLRTSFHRTPPVAASRYIFSCYSLKSKPVTVSIKKIEFLVCSASARKVSIIIDRRRQILILRSQDQQKNTCM